MTDQSTQPQAEDADAAHPLPSRARGRRTVAVICPDCNERRVIRSDYGCPGRCPSCTSWKQARKAALQAAPFCAVCGTRHCLQVHHIAPRRKGGGGEQANLIPLCVKHHRFVETLTVDAMAREPGALHDVIDGIAAALRWRQRSTAQILTRLQKEAAHAAA